MTLAARHPSRRATSRERSPRKPAEAKHAVILAGGRGTRLAPYSSVLPKPLMPVGDRAILELVFDQLAAHGVSDVTLCLGHLGHLIEAVLTDERNGERPVDVRFVRETKALGTAGPLRLLDPGDDTFLILNGDVLTDLDYRALVTQHREARNALTIAGRNHATKVEYGVLHLTDAGATRVTSLAEKPEFVSFVNMGIYAAEPWVVDFVPDGPFDLPDLVRELLTAGHRVGAYNHDGAWFDIGRKEDYERAIAAWSVHPSTNGKTANGALHSNGHRPSTNGRGHNGNSPEHIAHANGSPAADAREASFHDAINRVPTPVTVVTTVRDGYAHGTTVGAFSALSYEPPLITIALSRSADVLTELGVTRRFGINVLAAGHEHDGRICALKGRGKLELVRWHEAVGVPCLDGAAAFFCCDVEEILPRGDHVIVVGRVAACRSNGGRPLIYHARRYSEVS